MSAVSDRMEELESFLWRHVAPAYQDRRQGAAIVKAVLDRADAMVKAVRPPRAPKPPGPPKPRKPPAVHYATYAGLATCKAADFTSRRWRLSTDPHAVTCESCRKTPTYHAAAELAPAGEVS